MLVVSGPRVYLFAGFKPREGVLRYTFPWFTGLLDYRVIEAEQYKSRHRLYMIGWRPQL